MGGGILRELDELRAPMDAVIDFFVQQKRELDLYRKKYGALPHSDGEEEEEEEEVDSEETQTKQKEDEDEDEDSDEDKEADGDEDEDEDGEATE